MADKIKMEIIYNKQFNRANIRFSGIPGEDIRNDLKAGGWLYSKTHNVWYPKEIVANNSYEFAQKLYEEYYHINEKPVVVDEVITNLVKEAVDFDSEVKESTIQETVKSIKEGIIAEAENNEENGTSTKLLNMMVSKTLDYDTPENIVNAAVESVKSQIIEEYKELKKQTDVIESKVVQLSQLYDDLKKAHEEDKKKIEHYEKINNPSYVAPFLPDVNPVMDEIALSNKQNGDFIIISRSSENENSWHYTNYNSDYAEIDGGVIEADEENGWNIREAAKLVLDNIYPDNDYSDFEHINVIQLKNDIEAAERKALELKSLDVEAEAMERANGIREMSADLQSSGMVINNDADLSPEQKNSKLAYEKLNTIVKETFLTLTDEEVENNSATIEGKQKRYNTWFRPMVDEIMDAVIKGDEDIIKKINDFDLNKEKHVEGNKWYSAEEAYTRDVQYKLLPELYEAVQDKIKKQYEEQKIPYVIMYSSESPKFPSENKVYTVKEFNELLLQADSEFHNRKKYAEEKYGSADNYWDLERDDKLPEEDKGIQFGYDKTNFKFFNIPNPRDPEDTFSYEPSRYDIGDGNGSVFDYVRSTCSHDEFIEALNQLETQLYFPGVTDSQRQFVENTVKEETQVLKTTLKERMEDLDKAQNEYKELHKKWLIEATEADRVDEMLKDALEGIKNAYDSSMNNVFIKVLNEYPFASDDVSGSEFLKYTANEVKKMVISELYLPSRDAQKAMNAEDYKTYNSIDWAKLRRIWEKFPVNVNMTAYAENLLQEKCEEKGISVQIQTRAVTPPSPTQEEIEEGHNLARKVRAENIRKQYKSEQGSNYDSNLSTTEIAKKLREYIKVKYPGYKFSVRSEYFSGGSSISVELKKTPVEIATFETMKEYCEKYPSTERYNYEKQKYEKYNELSPEEKTEFINKILESPSFYNVNHYHFETMDYMNPEVKAVFSDVISQLESYNYDHSDSQTDYFDVNFYSNYDISSEAVTHSLEIIANKAAGITEEKAAKVEVGAATKAEIVMNKKYNMPNLSFDGKPDEQMRETLKAEGWLWNGKNGVWWPRTKEAQANAQKFAESIVNSFLNIENQNIIKDMNSENSNKAKENVNTDELSQEDIEICKKVIPPSQFKFTMELTEGEEGEFFKNKMKQIADTYRKINVDHELINKDGSHTVGFRYFLGDTEIFLSEIDSDGIGFGYNILNGDLQMSEWGSTSLEEILSIPYMEMDYHVPEGITIEKMLYQEHPDYFTEYAPKEEVEQGKNADSYTNEILDKIRAAGIEVVTDKEEFDRILGTENSILRMTSVEYNNKEVDAFVTDKSGFVDPEKIAAIDLYGFEKAKKMWENGEPDWETRMMLQDKSISDYLNRKSTNIYKKQIDDTVYGFVHNGKIYLNSELLNSNTAVHEYTHLWDAYTQKTNPVLWGKGLEIFKNTKYWNEVINDPKYQDIKDDENLVLSEIHSRICGDIAEEVLNRIAELDGEQTKLDAIDWNEETWNYIKEYGLNLDVHKPDSELTFATLHSFLSTPIKDLIRSRNISINENLLLENQINKIEKDAISFGKLRGIEAVETFVKVFNQNSDIKITNTDGLNILSAIALKNDMVYESKNNPVHLEYQFSTLQHMQMEPIQVLKYAYDNVANMKYSPEYESFFPALQKSMDMNAIENKLKTLLDSVKADKTLSWSELENFFDGHFINWESGFNATMEEVLEENYDTELQEKEETVGRLLMDNLEWANYSDSNIISNKIIGEELAHDILEEKWSIIEELEVDIVNGSITSFESAQIMLNDKLLNSELYKEVSKNINQNQEQPGVSELKPYNFFINDTANLDLGIGAEIEPITGLTAEQAVLKYAELKEKGLSPYIGLNIPDDIVFDDKEGQGAGIFTETDGKPSFFIGDNFVKQLKENNEHSQNVIAAYKELYETASKYILGVEKPSFVYEKENELNKPSEPLRVYTFSPFGYEGSIVQVETDLRRGIPAYDIVGIADSAVKETRERIRAAFANSGLEFPAERVLQSLSPADLRKDSPMDLSMALGILGQTKQYPVNEPVLALGELELSGNIRPVRGAVAAVNSATAAGITNIVCDPTTAELLKDIDGIKILTAENLKEANEKLLNKANFIEYKTMDSVELTLSLQGFIKDPAINVSDLPIEKKCELYKEIFNKEVILKNTNLETVQFNDDEWIKEAVDNLSMDGHFETVRAIEIAIAGKHNILESGRPGSGKTMLAQALFPALTPKLTEEESKSISRINSLAGLDSPHHDNKVSPFRMPHQSASIEGMLGGGPNCRPGEISLAHNGTLFLDEAAEFRSSVLQMLRVPIESNQITLSRAGRSTSYPANFQLVMASNPCPCGNYNSPDHICLCSAKSIDMYWRKFSDPLLDRVEIKTFVEKDEKDTRKLSIEQMKTAITKAFEIQRKRGVYNSKMTPEQIQMYCKLDKESQAYLEKEEDKLTPRGKSNLLKLSLTIANMDGREEIHLNDLKEARELSAPVFEKPKQFLYNPEEEKTLEENSVQQELTFDDPGVNDEVITNAENERKRITEPVLNGERTGMYKAFKDFEDKGVFDIKGTQVKFAKNGGLTPTGWKQLQAAMEIYRSKKFETFRYIMIDRKTGEIADQLAITSHMPNFCNVSKPNDETLKQVISRAEEKDYLIAVCHNHPSGNTTESSFDRELTDSLDRSLRRNDGLNRFLGHIILDHDTFNLAVPSESKPGNCHWKKLETLQTTDIDRFTAEPKPEWAGAYVGSTSALKDVAVKINDTNNWNDDFIPIVFTNADRSITGVQYYSKNFFENDSVAIRNELQFAAMEAGAIGAFPVITDAFWNKIPEKERSDYEVLMKNHVMNDAFTDVAIYKTTITEKYDIEAGRNYYNFYRDQNDRKIDVVATWTPQVNPRLFPPEGVGEVMENSKPFEISLNKNEFNGFWIPHHNAKVMKQGLEENKAPFLPDATGNIKAEPIYNMATGYCLPANRLIPVQFAKMEKGYNSNVVATRTTITGMENALNENEKGVFYNFKDEQGEIHTSSLFFPEQTQNPAAFVEASKDKIQQMDNLKDVSMVIATSDPKEYLGTYMAACRSGMKLSVDPQIAEEFKAKIMPTLENDIAPSEKRDKNLPSLSAILFEADKRGSEICRTLAAENGQYVNKKKEINISQKNDNEMCF